MADRELETGSRCHHDLDWHRLQIQLKADGDAESGSRGRLTPGPHTTLHAGPHRAVHDDGAHDESHA